MAQLVVDGWGGWVNDVVHTLKLTANAPENGHKRPKRKQDKFQPFIFRCELLVSGRVMILSACRRWLRIVDFESWNWGVMVDWFWDRSIMRTTPFHKPCHGQWQNMQPTLKTNRQNCKLRLCHVISMERLVLTSGSKKEFSKVCQLNQCP